jgi:hypothetical protein
MERLAEVGGVENGVGQVPRPGFTDEYFVGVHADDASPAGDELGRLVADAAA